MDILFQTRGLKLINRLFTPSKPMVSALPFYVQKADFPENPPQIIKFPRTSPENVGISSQTVNSYLKEIEKDTTLNLHGITMYKDGYVFAEGDFGLHRSDLWHTTYSLCKTVVSIAIGMLADEGKLSLDEKITDIFEIGGLQKLTKNGITVRDLLTMSTGISFNELGAVTEADWSKAFFESLQKPAGEERFEYNSMNTYMLARIVKKRAGVGVNDFLIPRLWNPLGISLHPWEICPHGCEKGGWGLYLVREDALKIGVLLLNGGVWQGKRLLSKEYISKMLTAHKAVSPDCGDYNYGYQVWIGRNTDSFLFNGMFGQNILAFKNSGIVIATNGGNDEVFQQSNFFKITRKYFGGLKNLSALPQNKKEYKALCKAALHLKENERKNTENFVLRYRGKRLLDTLCGSYSVKSKNKVSACLLPVVLRAVQNNYGNGVDKIALTREENLLHIDFVSPSHTRRLTAGLKEGVYTKIDFSGEKYIVGAFARTAKNEDKIPVITVNISFAETGSDRIMKMYFYPDGKVKITFTERPGDVLFDRAYEMLTSKGKLFSAFTGKTDAEYLRYRIGTTFNPTYICTKEML